MPRPSKTKLILSGIAAGLGYVAYMSDEDNRANLKELGFLAYFSAFTYGFGAAALISPAIIKSEENKESI